MRQLNAISVDDEASARDILENLLKRFCPQVNLIAKCGHVEEAVIAIKKHKPDLIFLDIEMPNYAGYEIVNFFEQVDFEMIFITAYDKYAVRAFEIAAVDYLLKPIDIDRLKQAVERTQEKFNQEQYNSRLGVLKTTLETKSVKSIAVMHHGYQHIVPTATITAIEAQESYCNIHTTGETYLASKNLKHFENLLAEEPTFIRTHKSWMVNRKYIANYSKTDLTINLTSGLVAKLSKYKKADFEAALLS